MNTTQCENGKNPRIEMKKVLKVVAVIVAGIGVIARLWCVFESDKRIKW